MSSLYRVLQDCPDGLEQYFRERIFERVLRTERNRIDTANALKLLLLTAEHQLDWLVGSIAAFSLLCQGSLSNISDKTEPEWYEKDDAHALLSSTTSFLVEACGDLVKVAPNDKAPLASTVRFIHRSTFDSLHEEQSQSFIEAYCAPYMNETTFVGRLGTVCFKYLVRQRNLNCESIDCMVANLADS